jgi:CRP/FNR family transcriptional regulator
MSEISPDLLKAFSFFAPFSVVQRTHIAASTTRVHLEANTPIFHAGEHSDKMYLIMEGRVRLTRSDEQGGEISLGVLETGQAFGELAMLSGEARMASATTLSPCEFLIVDRSLMAQAIMVGTPEDVLKMLASLSEQIRATNEREFQDLLAKRTQELQHEIQMLRIEIDQVKRQKQVKEIVESDFFQNVQNQARAMRARRGAGTAAEPEDPDKP